MSIEETTKKPRPVDEMSLLDLKDELKSIGYLEFNKLSRAKKLNEEIKKRELGSNKSDILKDMETDAKENSEAEPKEEIPFVEQEEETEESKKKKQKAEGEKISMIFKLGAGLIGETLIIKDGGSTEKWHILKNGGGKIVFTVDDNPEKQSLTYKKAREVFSEEGVSVESAGVEDTEEEKSTPTSSAPAEGNEIVEKTYHAGDNVVWDLNDETKKVEEKETTLKEGTLSSENSEDEPTEAERALYEKLVLRAQELQKELQELKEEKARILAEENNLFEETVEPETEKTDTEESEQTQNNQEGTGLESKIEEEITEAWRDENKFDKAWEKVNPNYAKNLEGTRKAFEKYSNYLNLIDHLDKYFTGCSVMYNGKHSMYRDAKKDSAISLDEIAKLYHEAKKDNSNPKLVDAVEKALASVTFLEEHSYRHGEYIQQVGKEINAKYDAELLALKK